jgi:acid phosphatase type 7
MKKRVISQGSSIPLCLLLTAATVACSPGGGSSGGAKSTDKTGDISNGAMTHGRPDLAMTAACGPGEVTPEGAGVLVRAPYLQQVTERSALLAWTVLDGIEGLSVDVELADGTPAASAPAAVDVSSHPSAADQMVARLDGLSPSTIYCYTIRQGDAVLAGPTGFRTAPPRGSDEPFTFTAFGDFGDGGADQQEVLAQINDVPFDLLLMLGDVAYDSGTRAQLEDNLFSVYAPLMRSISTWPASGNHEYGTDDAGPFREFFVLPENGGSAGRERWYSFDWGNVHFVALDTEKVADTQAEWLDADLEANDLPWTVVFFHRPPYSSGSHGSSMNVRNLFGPILERHGVNLVLAGHDHDYERMIPQNGVQYVVSGGGGHDLRGVGESDFTAFSATVLHFVAITVEPNQMIVHAIDATGSEFDSVAIRREIAAH